jgi:hypothetical protein
MSLPRFVGGSVGRLSFDMLNDAFSRIERLEQRAIARADSAADKTREVIVAKVLQVDTGTGYRSIMEATQATHALVALNAKTSGVRSADGGAFGIPLIGSAAVVGDVVFVVMLIAADGKAFFREIPTGAAFPAKVISYAQMTGLPQRWEYTMQKVAIEGTGLAAIYTAYGGNFIAYNGAEMRTDTALKGVGFSSSVAGLTYAKNPILADVVAVCCADRNGKIGFSLPNGYTVTC